VLAPLALLVIASRVASPADRWRAATACVVLSGLGATLSRGGILAFAAGAVVLVVLVGVRATARAVLAPVLGASVAVATLLPSMPAHSSPRPVLAVLGLAGGALLAGTASCWRAPRMAAATAVVALVAAMAAAGGGLGAVVDSRLTATSSDRQGETRAALRLAADHAVAGVGPGWRQFAWTDAGGTPRVARFAHNEYLQVLAELGAVGFVLLLGLLMALGRLAWSGRRAAPSPDIWAGVMAGLASLVVHAALDFGWHVPAVPLTGALLVGIVTTTKRQEQL
jgi:hypothetical protein